MYRKNIICFKMKKNQKTPKLLKCALYITTKALKGQNGGFHKKPYESLYRIMQSVLTD